MKFRAAFACVGALALIATACGDGGGDGEVIDGDATTEGEEEAGGAEEPDVDTEDVEVLSGEGFPEFITIGTGGTGGAFYPIGGAAGAMLADGLEGVESGVAETTGGSVENIQLLHEGRTDLILAQGDAVYNGWEGLDPFDGPQEVRTIGQAYVNLGQWVTTADTGVESFDDLPGNRFSTGDAGSGTEVFTTNVLESLGIDESEIEIQRLSFDDQTAAIRNGQLEAGSWIVAPGASSIADLASSEDVVFLEFTDEEVEAVVADHPYYTGYPLEAGTYQGQDEEVQTLGTWNSWMMSPDASEDFAYSVTKLLHENVDVLEQGHPSGGELDAENINNALTPLHVGAIRYFEEEGIEIDEELYPDEWEG